MSDHAPSASVPPRAGTEREAPAGDPLEQVLIYHEQTKHHFNRYARALGYMDWANQPNPFRRYDGAPLIHMPLLAADEEPCSPAYDRLYGPEASPSPITGRTISRFFEYALALSAWKEAGGTRWALRSNPSSGNLHPTEGYLLIGAMPEWHMAPALYHYAPSEHALERRADLPPRWFADLLKPFPPHAFLIALTSIHWRESWKYGERGFRYCQHDAGHAVGSVRFAAATLGWKMALLDDLGDDEIARLLGLDRADDYAGAEREHPDCVAVLWPPNECSGRPADGMPDGFPLALGTLTGPNPGDVTWHGHANRLSRGQPDPWDIIDAVSAASWKPRTHREPMAFSRRTTSTHPMAHPMDGEGAVSNHTETPRAGTVIRQRRSALAFDGRTPLAADRFFVMLSRVMPHADRPWPDRPMPWDTIPWDPAIHLALFVHRVDGLQPGLYMLVRDPATCDRLRKAMRPHFLWTPPPKCPADLPLFLLEAGDARRLAIQVSCHQDIAGDGAFSLGMIAEFDETLRRYGPWFYRRLFWETGIIGQVLYLEAEAAGVRATGIGCYFDDPVHQVFGFQDRAFQSLYHFTVGGPVDDPRLTTLPPYDKSRDG